MAKKKLNIKKKGQGGKIFFDKKEYNKANKSYNDSLSLYNKGLEEGNQWVKEGYTKVKGSVPFTDYTSNPIKPIYQQGWQDKSGSFAGWQDVYRKPVSKPSFEEIQNLQQKNINQLPTIQDNYQINKIQETTIVKPYYRPTQHQELPEQEFGGNIELEKVNELDMAKNGIHINPKNKGKFNATKKATGKTTEELTHSKNPITKKRAIFAQNAAKWKHENGGALYDIKAPYVYSYEHGGYIPMAKNGIQDPNLFQGLNYQQPGGAQNYSQTLGFQDIGNPYQQYQINKPLQKGNISIPEIQGATNFKQEIQTPEIHPYDFYNPQTGELTKQKQEKKQSNNSFSPIIPNMFSTNPYLAKANYYRKQAINNFSNIQGKQVPENQGLIGSKYGGKMENGGNFGNIAGGISNAMLADINTVKGFTDIFGGLQQNNLVRGIENQQQRQNLISQYQNPQPVISGGWGGFQPLEGTYVPVGAKYGASIPKAEYGIPSKFTGNRHYDGGIKINTQIPSTNANDMKDNQNPDLEVEGNEYYVPNAEEGGKQQNSVVLSDRKNVGWKGKSPSENYEELTKAELGISADKFNKGITKNDKFVADNLKFVDPIYNDKTQEAIKTLSAPIVSQMQDLAHQTYVKQEMVKNSKGIKNDLASIMQSNQQPMAQYGAQIPGTEVYNVADMFMKNGGKLPKAGGGKGLFKRTLSLPNTQLDKTKEQQDIDLAAAKAATEDFSGNYKLPIGVDPSSIGAFQTAQTDLFPDLIKDAYSHGFLGLNYEHRNALAKFLKKKPEQVKEEDYYNLSPSDMLKFHKDNKFYEDAVIPQKIQFKDQNEYDNWLKDQRKVGNFYIDKEYSGRGSTPYFQPDLSNLPRQVKEAAPSSERTKVDFNSGKSKTSNQAGFNPSSINFNIPNVYTKKPITSYNIAPQFVNPEVISPYVNDIQRLQYANTANLGYSGAELANRANMFSQGLSEYGKRYLDASQFNAQQRGRASEQNVQTALNRASSNRQNQWQTESAQNQRDAAIQQQMLLDQNPYLKMLGDKEHEQMVGELAKQIYDPRFTDYMNYVNSGLALNPQKADKEKGKYVNGVKVPVSYEDDNKKNGGRVKRINTKKFKSKKK